MSPPSSGSNPEYENPNFWDQRYQKWPEVFEWYQDYPTLKRILRGIIPLDADVLQIGVGTSSLQTDMVDDGYKSITSTDISKVAIEILTERDKSKPGLTYSCADCRHMPGIADSSFDYVIDKGTLDALMCGASARKDVCNTMKEIHRVLRPDGAFLCLTYGAPADRLPHLNKEDHPFQLTVYVIGRPDPGRPVEAGQECRLMGPFHFEDPVQREKLMSLGMVDDNVHWMYVCQRVTPPPAPPPHGQNGSGQAESSCSATGKMRGQQGPKASHVAELKETLQSAGRERLQ